MNKSKNSYFLNLRITLYIILDFLVKIRTLKKVLILVDEKLITQI